MTVRHFLYNVVSSRPSPTGSGSIRGWLEFYKLHPEEENMYVLFDPEKGVRPPNPGDILWFAVDEQIIAKVPIDSTFEDPLNGRVGLWYSGREIERLNGISIPLAAIYGIEPTIPPSARELLPPHGEQWLLEVKSHRVATPSSSPI